MAKHASKHIPLDFVSVDKDPFQHPSPHERQGSDSVKQLKDIPTCGTRQFERTKVLGCLKERKHVCPAQ